MQVLADLQQTVANLRAYLGLASVASMLPSFPYDAMGFPTASSLSPIAVAGAQGDYEGGGDEGQDGKDDSAVRSFSNSTDDDGAESAPQTLPLPVDEEGAEPKEEEGYVGSGNRDQEGKDNDEDAALPTTGMIVTAFWCFRRRGAARMELSGKVARLGPMSAAVPGGSPCGAPAASTRATRPVGSFRGGQRRLRRGPRAPPASLEGDDGIFGGGRARRRRAGGGRLWSGQIDFDGDEMNMHVPQSFETRAEVLELMMVPKCIVSPQSNRPVMGIVQDTLLGCRKITKRDTLIEKDVFMNILMWWEDFDGKVPAPAILKPRPIWTGKQVFNLIIPKPINLIRFSAWHSEAETGFITPGDTMVRIEKGELLSGTLCKKSLGTSAGSLIHVIWEEVGPDAARKFLGHTQRSHHGKINETISKAKNDVKELIKQAQDKLLEAEPGRTMMESFENRVNQVLNKARDDAGSSAQKSLSESNNLKAMVTAGSKGSFINISQMTACVGQQNVEGKRIPFGFIDRTLPHFTKDDYGPESRGFVENSYLRGLTPQEFFFHAMGGREGLIDTAVKTSETGYIQRRLVKAMEDIMVKYDGTVRNSLGDVIQFLYGEDGMDAVWIESQKLDSLKMKKGEFDNVFRYELDDENWRPNYMLPEHVDDLKTIREFRNVFEAEVQKLEADRFQLGTEIATTGDNTWPMPVNLKRLIWNAQKTFKIDLRRPSDMHPMEIVEAIDKLQERLKVVPGDDAMSIEAQKNATLFFNILLRSTFASKRVLKEYRLTKEALNGLLARLNRDSFNLWWPQVK
ncbi:hypothetical protein GUJ93_ZPchr0317g33743 [Zizania palustris]|uniref:DNA-directed RNA polymerase n=1 Tax=Zizania palustris TaxID=103762 RepID=A0A8J5QZ18_ZIZPA|nr:hypothetical protein GUJ93_ZPchr0317g33743 [Zizania palustris]